MGGGFSTPSFNQQLELLVNEDYDSSHSIWSKIAAADLIRTPFNTQTLEILVRIKHSRPENFVQLVKFVSELFEKTTMSNPRLIPPLCDVVLVLMEISHEQIDQSPWFRQSARYLSARIPIQGIISSINKLLTVNDSLTPQEMLADVTFQTNLLGALNLMCQGAFLGDSSTPDPSCYQLAVDTFASTNFLTSFFMVMEFVLTKQPNSKNLQYLNALLSYVVPAINSCPAWITSLKSTNQLSIHSALLPFLNPNTSNQFIEVADGVISLLYLLLYKSKAYCRFIESNQLGNVYIIGLLIYFEHKLETKGVTFFHSLTLLCISKLTSSLENLIQLNDAFNGNTMTSKKPPKGQVTDFLIDFIAHPLVVFREGAPLISLVAGILQNISSTTVSMTKITADRILSLLMQLFQLGFAEQNEFKLVVKQILQSIYQFIRFHHVGTQNLLLKATTMRDLFADIVKSGVAEWVMIAKRIQDIINACNKSLHMPQNDTRTKVICEEIVPVLQGFHEPPLPLGPMAMASDTQIIWFDWFRVMIWSLFPTESKKYNLQFVTFSMGTPSNIPTVTVPSQNEAPPQRLGRNATAPEASSPAPVPMDPDPFGDDGVLEQFLEGF